MRFICQENLNCKKCCQNQKKNSVVHVNTAYKQKVNKIQFINLKKIIDETSNELAN